MKIIITSLLALLLSTQLEAQRAAPAGGGTHQSTTRTTGVSDVVAAALAFKNMLSPAQQSILEMPYSATLARNWSGDTCGSTCRNGIMFGNLDSAQLQGALSVIRAVFMPATNNFSYGFPQFAIIRNTEEYLRASGAGSSYDTSLRWIAFLNTPSATGGWMLQFGGHSYAATVTFINGHVIGATPFYIGCDPWKWDDGVQTYAPVYWLQAGFTSLLSELTAAQLNTARLSLPLTDCYMVPGATNGGPSAFPAKAGFRCDTLTTTAKNGLQDIMYGFTQNMDTATANSVYHRYNRTLDSIYVSYSGSGTAGDPNSFFTAAGDYARIDGPDIWIEFSCQASTALPGHIAHHAVWHDRNHDYGLDLAGTPIDTIGTNSTGIAAAAVKDISVYPNPAQKTITFSLQQPVMHAAASVISLATGQTILRTANISGSSYTCNISQLPAGAYVLRLAAAGNVYTSRFIKE